MITASVAILDLILFFSFPHSNIHMAPYVTPRTPSLRQLTNGVPASALTLAKLYTNSLMALFNNRARITKGGPSPSQGSSFSLKPVNLSLSQRGRPGAHSFNGNTPGAIAVGVTKETVTDTREMGDMMVSVHACPARVMREIDGIAVCSMMRIRRMICRKGRMVRSPRIYATTIRRCRPDEE
jgi:hypothetical protein